MTSDLAVGIDLGTTNSCICVYRKDIVEIIPNEYGNFITPSYVAFAKKYGRLVGDAAKDQANFEPENTIFDVKRLIGRKFNDSCVQEDMANWPFKVIDDKSKPKIQITYNGKIKNYFPEEIISMILNKLKEIAESYLKMDVNKCVITVPAYFNDSQRQATKDAGKIAGFDVLKLINEPTAAAIAYTFNQNNKKDQIVLVYDLGGGTFDVSIVKIKHSSMRVLSTGGNTHLGGEDFDDRLMQYFIEDFEENHGIDLLKYKKALRRLRSACEKTKIFLSSARIAKIEIDNFIDGIDLNKVITRKKFEEINADHFRSTLETVKDCLKEAKLNKSQIDEIILVGGSSRIPMIKSMVQDFFDGKKLNQTINPDEAVAYGAAISAALVNNNTLQDVKIVAVEDVTPMSLGINVVNNLTNVIVPRNSTIPLKVEKTYYNSHDKQSKIKLIVLEGESNNSKDNNVLGEYDIDFPPAKKGALSFNVSFEIDNNGIMTVNCDGLSKFTKRIKFTPQKGRLSQKDFERIINDNEQAKQEQKLYGKITTIKNEIVNYCHIMTYNKVMPPSAKIKIGEMCKKISTWLDDNQNAPYSDYELKFDEMKKDCDTLLKRYDDEDACELVKFDNL